MSIEMKDLPLVSRTGHWRMYVGNKTQLTNIDMFRIKYKAAALHHEACNRDFGKESLITRKATRRLNFYHNQIDEERSDTFALLMYNTDEWVV